VAGPTALCRALSTGTVFDVCREKRGSNMGKLRRVLGWQLTSEVSSAKFAQVACYVTAIGFFALAMWKIATLQLTETELFFGVLQVLAVFMLIICVGTLVRIVVELTKKADSR